MKVAARPYWGGSISRARLREEGPGKSPGAATVRVQCRQGAPRQVGLGDCLWTRTGVGPKVGTSLSSLATDPNWGCKYLLFLCD
jgi:hypothetical protein